MENMSYLKHNRTSTLIIFIIIWCVYISYCKNQKRKVKTNWAGPSIRSPAHDVKLRLLLPYPLSNNQEQTHRVRLTKTRAKRIWRHLSLCHLPLNYTKIIFTIQASAVAHCHLLPFPVARSNRFSFAVDCYLLKLP